MEKRLLFILDKDIRHRERMLEWLGPHYDVMAFDNGETCLDMMNREPAVILMDLMVQGVEGLDILKRINLANRDIPVIVISGNNNLDLAVRAMKAGAFDYMLKPVDRIRLAANIEKAVEMHSLIQQIGLLKDGPVETGSFKNLIGQSKCMKETFAQIQKVSDINVNVYIHGESGVGKELVARAIHENSAYREGHFVDINCGAIPEDLQEAEFFGHEKGAFTSAESTRKGKLEVADRGTLFLDELAELSPKAQVKLLRFLQEKTFERVGGNQKIKVDLRIISATNKDIEKAVAEGRFREDLYYRLVVYPIYVPPLRDRREDIPLLAEHFIKKYQKDLPQPVTRIHPEAMDILTRYPWPGNVRQLENVVFRAMIAARSDILEKEQLPEEIRSFTAPEPRPLFPQESASSPPWANRIQDCPSDTRFRGTFPHLPGVGKEGLSRRLGEMRRKHPEGLQNAGYQPRHFLPESKEVPFINRHPAICLKLPSRCIKLQHLRQRTDRANP